MALPETTTHSFVIKVWLEETAVPYKKITWRGHITHVPSQRRQYLNDIDEVNEFISSFLQSSEHQTPSSGE